MVKTEPSRHHREHVFRIASRTDAPTLDAEAIDVNALRRTPDEAEFRCRGHDPLSSISVGRHVSNRSAGYPVCLLIEEIVSFEQL